MYLYFNSIKEDKPGTKWRSFMTSHWPAYKKWYLSDGGQAGPNLEECYKQFSHYMPELLPVYEQLMGLAQGDDLISKFLTLYCPPAFISGCSQAVWTNPDPLLIRNYDYSPKLFDATLVYTNWRRKVIAMSDCLWGVLDGINDAGLAVSLAFGGNKTVGRGFGIPLVLRYLLEVCETTKDAAEVLKRMPVHMAYNVTVVDKNSDFFTAYLDPARNTIIRRYPVATNYQRLIRWHMHAKKTETLARQKYLENRLADSRETESSFCDNFLHPPLYSRKFDKGHGTLYTSIYRSKTGEVEYHWPARKWVHSFTQFNEEKIIVEVDEA